MGEIKNELLSRTFYRRAQRKDIKQLEEACKTIRHLKRRSAAHEVKSSFGIKKCCCFLILLNMICFLNT